MDKVKNKLGLKKKNISEKETDNKIISNGKIEEESKTTNV
jgi:hypothetical protein